MDSSKGKSRRRFQQVNLLCDKVIMHLPTPTHGLLLLVGWRHADEHRCFRASTPELAKSVNVTKRHCQRLIDQLVEIGALKVVLPASGTRPATYLITGKPRSPRGDTSVISRPVPRGDMDVL
jgi:hypothetical protein